MNYTHLFSEKQPFSYLHLSCHLFFVFSCIQHTCFFIQKGLYNPFPELYNGQVVAYQKHYDGDSKYPQTDPRESGTGESLMSGKIWKITPEWQTEQFSQ